MPSPTQDPRRCFLQEKLDGLKGPFIAASDNVRLVPDQIRAWVPGTYTVLGTDGFGRSDTRPALRRHFEVDAENVVLAALSALSQQHQFDKKRLKQAIEDLNLDPDKVDPAIA